MIEGKLLPVGKDREAASALLGKQYKVKIWSVDFNASNLSYLNDAVTLQPGTFEPRKYAQLKEAGEPAMT